MQKPPCQSLHCIISFSHAIRSGNRISTPFIGCWMLTFQWLIVLCIATPLCNQFSGNQCFLLTDLPSIVDDRRTHWKQKTFFLSITHKYLTWSISFNFFPFPDWSMNRMFRLAVTLLRTQRPACPLVWENVCVCVCVGVCVCVMRECVCAPHSCPLAFSSSTSSSPVLSSTKPTLSPETAAGSCSISAGPGLSLTNHDILVKL